MNTFDLGLEDIITPVGVSHWPPAPGWWLLACLLIASAVLTGYGIRRYRRKWVYRHQGLRLLRDHYQQWRHDGDADQARTAMLSTLKRIAVCAYPQTKTIVSLHGKDWLAFLNQQTRQPLFTGDAAYLIILGQYTKNPDVDINQLYECCRRWTRQHRAKVDSSK